MYVLPAPGLQIRDPIKRDLIPKAGREVSDSDPYWIRRIATGDVVLGKPPAAAPALAPTTVAPAPSTPQVSSDSRAAATAQPSTSASAPTQITNKTTSGSDPA